jgi:hypothetical protein
MGSGLAILQFKFHLFCCSTRLTPRLTGDLGSNLQSSFDKDIDPNIMELWQGNYGYNLKMLFTISPRGGTSERRYFMTTRIGKGERKTDNVSEI